MTLKNEALREYATLLQANGFTIYEPKGTIGVRYFTYSRLVDGVECFGTVQQADFGGYSHTMPIKPSHEHGSSMFVANVPDELTVQAARKVAQPTNWNDLVGTQQNYRDDRWLDRHGGGYTKWDTISEVPPFAAGDRVEYGGKGRPWRGTVIRYYDNHVDIQWDHTGDVDVAVRIGTRDLRMETPR